MKVKKYIAPTMPEAMKKIRSDLGKDAVILNSKEIRTGGFLGFFTKPSLEVIAALDPEPLSPSSHEEERKPVFSSAKPVAVENSVYTKRPPVGTKVGMTDRSVPDNSPHLPKQILTIDEFLTVQGVTSDLKSMIVSKLLRRWYQEETEMKASEKLQGWLREELLSIVREVSFGGFEYKKKILNLIGPTGVGKTTTIAKIAADAVLNKKKKTALITTDTYRIAAIEQLKTYAEILNVPLEVAYNQDDFKNAKDKFKDYDVILVDSAGRNFKKTRYIDDLEQMYQFDEDMENYLVFSLTSKYTDMIQIADHFKKIPIEKLVFTKKDETDSYGEILNLIYKMECGVAYVTFGQNVPDDLTEVSPEKIVDLILGEMTHV
ncbi:flagellar biosynthesis protein FlhF [Pseudalkalibacillus sp. SCS-8]|uniref:flagellar biosynthesis protein FlhF n=1 Tax=Pseudalkalibacillus nanhaiensis TaxID=3115291 RepID=UPI0032DBD756